MRVMLSKHQDEFCNDTIHTISPAPVPLALSASIMRRKGACACFVNPCCSDCMHLRNAMAVWERGTSTRLQEPCMTGPFTSDASYTSGCKASRLVGMNGNRVRAASKLLNSA